MALNERQREFVGHYLHSLNATKAAIAAGYSGKTARSQGQRLLTKADIQEAIQEGRAAAAERNELTLDEVIAELRLLGFSNMQDYMKAGTDGDPYLDFSKLTREQAAALVEVTVEDFVSGRGEDARDVKRVKFRLADKRAALVDLGKHLGGFKERHEHTGPSGGPIEHDFVSEFIGRIAGVASRLRTDAVSEGSEPGEGEGTSS